MSASSVVAVLIALVVVIIFVVYMRQHSGAGANPNATATFSLAQSVSGTPHYLSISSSGAASLEADGSKAAVLKATAVDKTLSVLTAGTSMYLQDTATGMVIGSFTRTGHGVWVIGVQGNSGSHNQWSFAPTSATSATSAGAVALAKGSNLFWFNRAGSANSGTTWVVYNDGATDNPLATSEIPANFDPSKNGEYVWQIVDPPVS